MTPSEQIDALMKLAEFRMTRVSSRREHEWKVTLALWALLGAGILNPDKIPHSSCLARDSVILILILTFAGHAGLWISPHWHRSKEDILISFFYCDRARNLVLSKEKIKELGEKAKLPEWPSPKPWLEFLTAPTCWAQILTTALLAIIVGTRVLS